MKKLLLLAVLMCATAHAETFNAFMKGFQKEFFIRRTDRGEELSHHVWVAPFGPLGRIFSPDAIATYNDKLNLISIDKEHLENGKVKDARQILGATNASYKIATIFHEMGHAELDVFIENGREATDMLLNDLFRSKFKAFYKKHFPNINPKLIFHEHFGYYRSELIDFMANEISNVLLYNGYNRYKKRCFLNQTLKQKLTAGISREEFQKLIPSANSSIFYRSVVHPGYIYVKGKDLNLKHPSIPVGEVDFIHLQFWSYHQDFYGFPMNQNELIKRMGGSEISKNLADCRGNLWDQWQGK